MIERSGCADGSEIESLFGAPSEEEAGRAPGAEELAEKTALAVEESDAVTDAEPEDAVSEEEGSDVPESADAEAEDDPFASELFEAEHKAIEIHDVDEHSSLFGMPEGMGDPALGYGDGSEAESDSPRDADEEPLAGATSDEPSAKPLSEPCRMTPALIARRRREGRTEGVSAKLRFCCATLLAMMLAVLELFPVFGVNVTVPLGISRVRGGSALLDLQFLLLAALLAWRTLAVGFRYLFSARFRAESILALSVLFVGAYDVFLYVTKAVEPPLLALPLAVTLVLSIWLEVSECELRRRVLALLARGGAKTAAVREERRGKRQLTVSACHSIDGYDERISSFSESGQLHIVVFFLALLCAAGAAIAAAMTVGEAVHVVASALSAYLLTAPFAALFSRRMYLAALSNASLERGVAVFGEATVLEAAEASCLSVTDAVAFANGEIRIRVVNVFSDSRLDEILYLISGILRQTEGPLARVLLRTAGESDTSYSASILSVEEDGITAESDGRTVHIGSESFMDRMTCSLAADADADQSLRSDRMSVMYCAVDRELKAKFYLEYLPDASFEARAEQNDRLGIKTEIRTFDPNLTSEYVEAISGARPDAIRVRKCTPEELPSDEETGADSGIFTLGEPSALLGVLAACKQYLRARRRLSVFKIAEILAGAALFWLWFVAFSATLVPAYALSLYLVVLSVLTLRAAAFFGKRAYRHDRVSIEQTERKS